MPDCPHCLIYVTRSQIEPEPLSETCIIVLNNELNVLFASTDQLTIVIHRSRLFANTTYNWIAFL